MIIHRKNKGIRATNEKKHRVKTEALLMNNASVRLKEAYKLIRTNIIYSSDLQRGKQFIVTSAAKDEGKTMTCINLAISFAQTGKKVIVIDGDLRKPQVHEILGISNSTGLSDILARLCKVDDAIKKVEEQGIDVITAGSIHSNPAELLSRDQMKNLLYELSKSYDYIFIDTPPTDVVADAIILSNMVAGAILVVRKDKTSYKDIDEAMEKLSFVKAKVFGIVFTG